MRNKKILFLFLIAIAFFPSCTKSEKSNARGRSTKAINIVYVEWDCARATSYILAEVLQQEGYKVNLSSSLAAMMWQGIKTGTQDIMTCAWLPVTHNDYYNDALDGDVEKVGVNYLNAQLGLVVPSYVEIDTIEELEANAAKFNNEIIGIDPGAGLMANAEKAIEAYSLDSFSLVASSGAAMTSTLQQKINNEEWVVVTGWEPHWKFSRWDLKFLEDEKNIFGESETVYTVTRANFLEDYPELNGLLERFSWTAETLGEAMDLNAVEGTSPSDNAKLWIEKNKEIVDLWLGKDK